MERLQGKHKRNGRQCTHKHLDGDRHGAVERRVAGVLGHHRQVDDPVGHLLVVQGVVHADHCKDAQLGGSGEQVWARSEVPGAAPTSVPFRHRDVEVVAEGRRLHDAVGDLVVWRGVLI